ncbi:MAG: hypothetical protein RJB66_754 [Pseudomonadota bacterium]|jgi:cell division initiation protein
MKITPVDVAHKTFSKGMYGLNPNEVRTYLEAIADQLEVLIREKNEFRDKLRERDHQINEYKERDQLLKNTLTTASQMSEKIREDAEKRAELILQEAQIKSQEMQKETQESLRRAYTEINELKSLRIQFETNMRALAHAHLALVEEGQKYMGMPETTSHHTTATAAANDNNNNTETSDKLSSDISPLAVDMI